MQAQVPRAPRRYELDWLRVGAILAVFTFHSTRFFDTNDWHVKNATTYMSAEAWMGFLANWLMPFMFAISGASLNYALRSRGAGRFVVDKVRRLLVPLLVGVFTHAMLQVYLERVSHHQFSGSFLSFVPHYFAGLYGLGGNFAWTGMHLWYLLVLFTYSLLLYPLFRWLTSGQGRQLLDALGGFLARPGAVYLLALPLACLSAALDPRTFLGTRDYGAWPLVTYILFLFYGFLIVSHDRLQGRIRQSRWSSLAVGGLCFAVLLALWAKQGDPVFGTLHYALIFGVYGISSWCWVLAFLGFGFAHLTRGTPAVAYANEAVLPFYVMHQSVLLAIGYFVTRWPVPDLAKLAIISSSAFIAIAIVYEFLIRRVNALRFLFGMKPRGRVRTSPSGSGGMPYAKA